MTTEAARLPRAGDRAALALPGLAAVLGAAVLLQGGFYGRQLAILTGGLAALAVAVASKRAPGPAVAVGFVPLAAALAASAAANAWPGAAAKPAATLAVAAGAVVVGARAARRDGARAVLEAVTAVAVLAAVVGIAGVAFHVEPLALHAGSWLLASTLTYQNAAAALFALAVPAALVLDAPMQRMAAVPIAAALAATQSRGGILAAAVALGVLLGTRAVSPASLARALAGAAVAFAGLLPSVLGWRFGAPVALAGLVAGCALTARIPAAPSRRARGLALLAVVALALAIGFTPLRGRIGASTNDRSRVWSQTIAGLDGHIALGTGPGTYRLVGPKDGHLVSTEYAHNEYLQALSETGVAGLAAVLLSIAMFGRALLRTRCDRRVLGAACAAGAAFVVHSGFDFVWRVPVLVAVVFALLGAATSEGGER